MKRTVTITICDNCEREVGVTRYRVMNSKKGTSHTLDLCQECAAPITAITDKVRKRRPLAESTVLPKQRTPVRKDRLPGAHRGEGKPTPVGEVGPQLPTFSDTNEAPKPHARAKVAVTA